MSANLYTLVSEAVKLIDRDEGLVAGWGIPYGGPLDGKDLDGEAFTKDTELYLGAYKERPLLYHHGMDVTIGYEPIGAATKATRKERGMWVESQLAKAHPYREAVLELLGEGLLGYSSGAHPRSIAKTANGAITNWFWYEQSLTPTPANPFAMISVKAKRYDDQGQLQVLPIKAQAAVIEKLGRVPRDAAEAEEASAPFIAEYWGGKAKDTYLEERIKELELQLAALQGTPPEAVKDIEVQLRRNELENLRIRDQHGWMY